MLSVRRPLSAAAVVPSDAHDPSTNYGSTEGDDMTVQAPGSGVIVHIAGRVLNEDVEDFRAVWLTPDDPGVVEKLCDALAR